MNSLLSLIVPVFNEGDNLRPFLDEVAKDVPAPYELLIVYDFDEDSTVPAARRIMEQDEFWSRTIRLVKNNVHRGPSGALRTGFKQAAGDMIVVSMADRSDDLSQIKDMVNCYRAGADIVAPSRYCEGGRQQINTIKAWIPRWIGNILHLLTGLNTHDSTNSFRFYSRRVLSAFPLVSTHSFSVTLEILAKAHCLNFQVKEIPTEWRVRQVGTSKFPFISSLGSYLPWFFIGIMKNRFISLPLSWRRRLIGAPDPAQV